MTRPFLNCAVRGMRGSVAVLTGMLVFIAALAGCDKATDTKELQRQVGDLTKVLTDYVGDAAPTKEALTELKKLQQFEYKIISVPADTTPTALESSLNELGRERWECFHVEKRLNPADPAKSEIALFCKRRPETPLRFIPRNLITS